MHGTIRPAALALMLALPAAPALASATASFVDRTGKVVGSATLTDTGKGVLIEAEAKGLTPNRWVGFHIHETGTCAPDGQFKSAGGHYNPTGANHGYLDGKGPHAGDMPNQYVGADGTLRATVFNPMVRLEGGDAPIAGKALMIHGGPDDYRSQPSGDAGDRQACAAIR